MHTCLQTAVTQQHKVTTHPAAEATQPPTFVKQDGNYFQPHPGDQGFGKGIHRTCGELERDVKLAVIAR